MKREPTLFVGGQSTGTIKQRAQLTGGNSWIYIVGGLAAAGVAAPFILDDEPNSEPCISGNC